MLFYAGIDLGGTNVKFLLLRKSGKSICSYSIPTLVSSPEETLENIALNLKELIASQGLSETELVGIGMGVPGPTNSETGLTYAVPFLKWENIYISDILLKYFKCKIKVGNDGNVNALGELYFGVAKGYKNIVMLTLGTGVGTGVICNGKLLTGSKGIAGEAGHIRITTGGRTCVCGNKGCLESFCSAKGIEYLAEKNNLTSQTTSKLTAKDIFNLARDGNPIAKKVVKQYIKYLSIGLMSIIHLFNPEMIVLGGGIAHAGDILFKPLKRKVNSILMTPVQECMIVPCKLYEEAGPLGAISLLFLK